MDLMNYRLVLVCILLMFVLPCGILAEDPEDEFLDMSLEDLMDVQITVSASRKEQKISHSAVPITIITAEDIHYSGLTNIPDIIQFYTGIDMTRHDRHETYIGVHGFGDQYSDRLLTLVDGRAADDPLYTGQIFERLPVLMEDIERIEIIRGPGGAAWGANAFTGVINIITKDVEDTIGTTAATTFNHGGDSYTYFRHGQKDKNWIWRFSGGYEDFESSEDLMHDDGFTSDDTGRTSRFNLTGRYRIDDDRSIETGIGFSKRHEKSKEWYRVIRPYIKLNKQIDENKNGYLQFYSNIYKFRTGLTKSLSLENDVEAQLDWQINEKRNISVGANLRINHFNSEDLPDTTLSGFDGIPYTEQSAGAFFIDRYTFNDRWWYEGQIRLDWFSVSQTDWSGRVALFHALDDKKDHTLRFAAAKAVRTPLSSVRTYRLRIGRLAPGVYVTDLVPNHDLENEQTWSLELGYFGKLNDWLTFKTDLAYQRMRKMLGYEVIRTPFGFLTTTDYISENRNSGELYVADTELTAKFGRATITGWYSFNRFEPGHKDVSIRAYAPAENKYGLRGRWHIDEKWTLNANCKFSGKSHQVKTDGNGDYKIDRNHRLDFSISRIIADGNGELMFGITDILNRKHAPALSGQNTYGHEMFGRTWFARLQIKF